MTVVVILVVAMGLVFAVQYRWLQRELIERLGLASTPLSDVIKGSLRHAMQTRDLSELGAIIDNVSRQPGVIKVFVVDKRGEIKFSPAREEIGRRFALTDRTCQICHRLQPESRSRTVILAGAGRERVFRNVNPIANEPACFGCHGAQNKLNGVLISDFSMAEVDRQLAATFREMVLGLLLAVGATGLAITLLMNRLVIGKLERIVEAIRLLGKGRLDLQIAGRPGDELGELAVSFNEMVDNLRRAAAVRERKELLESVLNNVRDAVAVFAPDETLIAFNHGAAIAFGLAPGDARGSPPALLGEDQAGLLARARDAGPLTAELKLQRSEGSYFPALVRVVPLRNEREELLAYVAVVQDLTEARVKERLEEQLRHSEKLAAVGRLAAGVAHELNNPLGNVLLYSKLLLEGERPSEVREANARRIVDNAFRCKAIVRALLDYGRQSDLQPAWTDLNTVVERAVGLAASEPAGSAVHFEVRLASGLPKIRCDAQQIEQVLVNLIRNGAEATDPGGRVTVFTGLSAAEDAIVVGVQDDGCGIPADVRSRIFEPFYTTKAHGTGLGLAISYGIVERHHGKIWVESTDDGLARGSTFFVQLPLGT